MLTKNGYWLASPSHRAGNDKLWIFYEDCSLNGNFEYYVSTSFGSHGLRPVVCLKEGIELEEQLDGTFHIK